MTSYLFATHYKNQEHHRYTGICMKTCSWSFSKPTLWKSWNFSGNVLEWRPPKFCKKTIKIYKNNKLKNVKRSFVLMVIKYFYQPWRNRIQILMIYQMISMIIIKANKLIRIWFLSLTDVTVVKIHNKLI